MMDLLKKHKVLICAGTGGVGKTTISASLAVLAARSGLRALVMTIDPAHRLAQSLGLEKRPGEIVEVTEVPGLSALMIDARREFDTFVLGSVDKGIAAGLFNNRLYQQLVTNLTGSQEFTSLLRLSEAVKSKRYDLVILDTPPAQNAVDFLQAPERIYALFQDSVIGWFANPDSNESWFKRTLHRGTRIVTNALESVTGSKFIQELKDFFGHMACLKDKIAKVSRDTTQILHSPSTGFVLVTGFDEAKLNEALEFQGDLKRDQLALRAVIVNRWFPEWTEKAEWKQDDPLAGQLREFYNQFAAYFQARQVAYKRFVEHLGQAVPVLRLPDFNGAVQGIDDLTHLSEIIEEKWETAK